ncbi:hypothetical protein B0O99DRAFT_632642, partial [Bisporella sp. PMI_857]
MVRPVDVSRSESHEKVSRSNPLAHFHGRQAIRRIQRKLTYFKSRELNEVPKAQLMLKLHSEPELAPPRTWCGHLGRARGY